MEALTRTDEELIEAVRSGDRAAYAELWERHRRPGYVAARNLSSTADPEDVVSEAFARLFRLLQEGKGPTRSFRPYLYQVIRTIIREELRPFESELDDSMTRVDDEALDIESAFDRQMAAKALQKVPEKYRGVLWELEVEGRTPREAARTLGITANHVSALRVRGRKALRKAWIEAQVTSVRRGKACEDVATLLVREAIEPLRSSQSARLRAHIDRCRACHNASSEAHSLVDLIGSRTLLVLIGLGAGAGAVAPWGGTAASAVTGGAAAGAGAGAASTSVSGAVSGGAMQSIGIAQAMLAPKAIAAMVSGVLVVGAGAGVAAVAAQEAPAAISATPQRSSSDPQRDPLPKTPEARDPVSQDPKDPEPDAEQSVERPDSTQKVVEREETEPRRPELTPQPPTSPPPSPKPPRVTPPPPKPVAPMTPPEVSNACAARVDGSTFSVQGVATAAGTIQVAPVQGDVSSFVSASVDGGMRWATGTVTLTGTGVSFRGVAPDGTLGSWISVNLQVC